MDAHIAGFVIKTQKNEKNLAVRDLQGYSESTCTSQVTAKGKGKANPARELYPAICSTTSLRHPREQSLASSSKDHTLLDCEKRHSLVLAVKPGSRFLRFRALSFGGICFAFSGICRFFAFAPGALAVQAANGGHTPRESRCTLLYIERFAPHAASAARYCACPA